MNGWMVDGRWLNQNKNETDQTTVTDQERMQLH